MGLVGDSKPVAFVEDTAVAPARLPAFYERFEAIVDRQGSRPPVTATPTCGCLHIRPILNVKTREGVKSLRTIAREVSDLVVEFEGP